MDHALQVGHGYLYVDKNERAHAEADTLRLHEGEQL